MTRLDWKKILEIAAEIVRSYDTPVTLRQLFYRLVAVGEIPNAPGAYKYLSKTTAEARRNDEFPDLADNTRWTSRGLQFESPRAALSWLAKNYRVNRTRGQSPAIYVGVEKATMVEQFRRWLADFGLPILPLRGYSSQAYIDEVAREVEALDEDAILIYTGDFDPSGMDIDRDFIERANCFSEVIRIAVLPEQIEEFDLQPLPGKERDTRASSFVSRFGDLVQVELEALNPTVLRLLLLEEVEKHIDRDNYQTRLEEEKKDREYLWRLANEVDW